LAAGPGLAQLLDHAKAHAAAAVHRHAGGLVDGQQVLVFETAPGTRAGHRRLGLGWAAATRTGGRRTSSPSAKRVSAAARPLLTRTSPERMTR
jgi:hypothetical protein